MKLPYFSENEYQELFDEVSINASQYLKSNNGSWVNQKFIGRNYYKESRIDAVLPSLTIGSSSETELMNIYGGSSSLSGTLINSISKLITTLLDLGRTIGSAINYSKNNKTCNA